jgi:hypothetical protein
MRAVVLAVRRLPEVNARFDDDAGIVTRLPGRSTSASRPRPTPA